MQTAETCYPAQQNRQELASAQTLVNKQPPPFPDR